MPKFHSREALYKFMWEHCDYRGRLTLSQGEVANQFGISYQRLSVAVNEFIGMGMINKYGHEYTLLYEPDRIPWDTGFVQLRKRYIENKKLQLEES